MPGHKFAVGQKVAFQPELGQFVKSGEVFIVVRQLPEAAGMFQYHIKRRDGRPRARRSGSPDRGSVAAGR